MERRKKLNLFLFFLTFLLLNIGTWLATNYQLIEGVERSKAFWVSMGLSIPISILAFYGTKFGYDSLGSAWSVRLSAFAVSYAVFPFLTYVFLKETPFDLKTMLCVLLSVAIVGIQILWPNS